MRIVTHTDLIEALLSFNASNPDESFPVRSLDSGQLDALGKFEIREYIYDGMQSERSEERFASLMNDFKKEIWNVLGQDRMTEFLFAIAHRSSLISRLRSYRKFLDSSRLDNGRFLEKQISLSNRESRFAFLSTVADANFGYLTKFLFDSTYSFIIGSDDDLVNKRSIDRITSLFELSGITHIDFYKVMRESCQGVIIFIELVATTASSIGTCKYLEQNSLYSLDALIS